jgi:hypothetical protein
MTSRLGPRERCELGGATTHLWERGALRLKAVLKPMCAKVEDWRQRLSGATTHLTIAIECRVVDKSGM